MVSQRSCSSERSRFSCWGLKEGATTTRVERVEVGVTIRVTPTVVGDRVILEIAPELSNFTTASQREQWSSSLR